MSDDANRFDMLRWMDAGTASAYRAAVRRRRYQAGQTIYLQGEEGGEMYRILSGSVRLSVTRSDGREVIFVLFEPGDCFGDSSLVDGDPRPQTATAVSEVELEVLDLAAFRRLRADCPGFSDALLKLLARQMRVVSGRYADSSLEDLPTRIAGRIVEAAREIGSDSGATLGLRLSQSEIAAMVGASRQSVNKVLQRFQSEGMVTLEYGAVLVDDLERLERRAARD